jgi:hypothetical protein
VCYLLLQAAWILPGCSPHAEPLIIVEDADGEDPGSNTGGRNRFHFASSYLSLELIAPQARCSLFKNANKSS